MATEFVGIQLDLIGADGVRRDLMNLDKILKSFGGRKKFDAGFNDARRQVVQYRGELEKLNRTRRAITKGIASGELKNPAWSKRLAETNSKIDQTKSKLREAQQAVREFGQASREAGMTFGQSFKSISSKVGHVGSAMQSMGNAITRITAPFRRLTTGLLYGAGYRMLNMITEGFRGSFERADIMTTYDRSLKALGLNAGKKFSVAGKEAKTAKENLDEAVQGLPTGLDEIMAAQKVYAGATGEMVESTKIAIAANNTFLASAMDSRSQRFIQRYLAALGSGAELTGTQWQSMARLAPLAMRAVSKELGYADKDYKQFTQDVQQGTISGKQFLKAFMKVGTEGAVARAARVTAMTWGGLASNIQIATKRMGQNIIETLNETFKENTGRTLLQHLLGWDEEGNDVGGGIKHWINDLSESVQDWIKANPDKIIDFFETLKSIDWKGFLKGMAEGFGEMFDILKKFADALGGGDMEKLGKNLVRLSYLGQGLTLGGGLLKGTRHIWGFFGALGGAAFGRVIGGGGLFGFLGRLFGSKRAVEAAGKTAAEVPTVSQTFRSAFNALKGLITAAGAVLIVGTTGFVAFKEVKSIIRDLHDIVNEINSGDWDNVGYVVGGMITAIGFLTELFQFMGKALGPEGLMYEALGALSTVLATGAITADMALLKEALVQIKDAIGITKEIVKEVNSFGDVGELNTDNIAKAIDAANRVAAVLSGDGDNSAKHGTKNFLLSLISPFAPAAMKGAKALDTGFAVSQLQSVADAIKTLKGIAKSINSLDGIEISEDAPNKARKIIEAIGEVGKAMPTLFQTGTQGFKNFANNAEHIGNALQQIKRMARSINKLAATDINNSGFSGFVTMLSAAINEMKSLSGDLELDIEVKLSDNFGASVTKVCDEIKKGKDKIKKLKSAVAFSIPVTVTFSVTTNLGAVLAKIIADKNKIKSMSGGTNTMYTQPIGPTRGPAKGGLIYRAKGGRVPFKRIGTDTVPAMLTPGEYVHNKRAVNTFGIDFMRKVNNLDVKGAMSELMHRAGHMASMSNGTHITNNYNNNQKVVQNINTNSPDFAFKSASRFVGAF